jgi:tRNA1Val (adenine37-N6)-methyltransferase
MTSFHCQQFSVQQQHAAMKVCSDSLLFAAMATPNAGDSVLDIGTGTGLLALVMAQLGAGEITAIEIDPATCQEATRNFAHSPWSAQLQALPGSIQDFARHTTHRYNFIISNPPFFAEHFKSSSANKRLARHTDRLSHNELISIVKLLLSAHGQFYVLLPYFAVKDFCKIAQDLGLYVYKQCTLQAYTHKTAKVAALSFSPQKQAVTSEILTLYSAPGVHTPECRAYLQNYLLKYAVS